MEDFKAGSLFSPGWKSLLSPGLNYWHAVNLVTTFNRGGFVRRGAEI